jgi:hypothetical protein
LIRHLLRWLKRQSTSKQASSVADLDAAQVTVVPSSRPSRAAWRTNVLSSGDIKIDSVSIATVTMEGPTSGFVSVVGESHYQEALRSAKAEQFDEDSVVTVVLQHEPDNPYDSNAVAVVIEGRGKVGYLERAIAKRYAPKLAAAGGRATCIAQLRGGDVARPSIGVVLDAATVVGAPLLDYDPTAPMDYESIKQYHARRDTNRQFVKETRAFEKIDIATAITRYKQALETMREYENFAAERKLFRRLAARRGDTAILDRLTLCLVKAGCATEAVAAITLYFNDFPDDATTSLGKSIIARGVKCRDQSSS